MAPEAGATTARTRASTKASGSSRTAAGEAAAATTTTATGKATAAATAAATGEAATATATTAAATALGVRLVGEKEDEGEQGHANPGSDERPKHHFSLLFAAATLGRATINGMACAPAGGENANADWSIFGARFQSLKSAENCGCPGACL